MGLRHWLRVERLREAQRHLRHVKRAVRKQQQRLWGERRARRYDEPANPPPRELTDEERRKLLP
jgi:hypothetical protein